MEAVAQANGSGTITLSFQTGTNPDLAQVDVQNRLSRATPRATGCDAARESG
jgi:multidrug efflux pump